MTKKQDKGKPRKILAKKATDAKKRQDAAAAAPKRKGLSHKGSRVMKDRAPKAIENTKCALFLRGSKTSEVVHGLLKELHLLRKPHGKMTQRKNPDMHPFEDPSSVEFLCEKNDCSLFAVANHSKKRPHNLTIGRTFDGRLLDQAELGVLSCTTLAQLQAAYPGAAVTSKRLGAKPCVVFVGQAWEASEEHRRLRSLLLDFVRGVDVSGVNLAALDHVIAFTANPATSTIHLRTYALQLKRRSGGGGEDGGKGGGGGKGCPSVPKARLVLSAPAADLTLRRAQWASRDLLKQALRQPREVKPVKVKNVTTSALGETLGQIHMERQDYGALQTRKVKALHAHKAVPIRNRSGGDDDGDDGGGDGGDDDASEHKEAGDE